MGVRPTFLEYGLCLGTPKVIDFSIMSWVMNLVFVTWFGVAETSGVGIVDVGTAVTETLSVSSGSLILWNLV